MMRRIIAAVILGLLMSWMVATDAKAVTCSAVTPTAGIKTVCSLSLGFSGQCGVANFPGEGWDDILAYVNPWEKTSITIVGVVLDFMMSANQPVYSGQFFAGNSYTPDAMTGVFPVYDASGIAIGHAETWFPPGSGMQFPAASQWPPPPSDQNLPHIDVHRGPCSPNGANYNGYLILYYELNP